MLSNVEMQRRDFFTRMLAGVTALKLSNARAQQLSANPYLERPLSGTPHKGKVLAAIQPHADDVALLCGGTVAKLIQEGYTGYLIRTTNDLQAIVAPLVIIRGDVLEQREVAVPFDQDSVASVVANQKALGDEAV